MRDSVSLTGCMPDVFSPQQAAILMEGCPAIRKNKGDLVFAAGDMVDSIFYLKHGTLMTYMLMPQGKRYIWDFHKKGSFHGIVNAFSEEPSFTYCEAREKSELLVCPVGLFLKRVISNNLFREAMCSEARKNNWMFRRFSMMENLSDVVRHLYFNGLTQQEIADFTGYSRVHISRICSNLSRQNIEPK